jgi:isopenicillin-N N-acyltransferase-like protein
MLATPQGPADLEVTLDDVHVLQRKDSPDIAHANHCLAPELAPVNSRFPELIQSHARQRRIDQLLAAAGDGPVGVDAIKAILRDHDNHPRSICRHANDDPVTGFWRTIISVIIEPEKRQMHISRGVPCEHDYETYKLS